MNPFKRTFKKEVIENGRVEERGQSNEEWEEEVEEEARFEAEDQGYDWDELSD